MNDKSHVSLALRQSGGVLQNLFGEGLHGGNLLNVRNLDEFLTIFKRSGLHRLPVSYWVLATFASISRRLTSGDLSGMLRVG